MPLTNTYLTFDLWQTLIIDSPQADARRSQMRCEGLWKSLSRLKVNATFDDLKRAYDRSARKFQEMWQTNSEISTDQQLGIILSLFSPDAVSFCRDPGSMETMRKAYIDPLFAFPPPLDKDAKQTLQALRSQVNKIGLISNTGRVPGAALRLLLEKHGISEFFDSTIFSDEVGYRKPNVRIFQEAAKRLGAEISNGVHIGDNPETDVWGAKHAGMRAILLVKDLPEGFRMMPDSTITLSRTRWIPDLEINPDGQISSLIETVNLVDLLGRQQSSL
jgi:HAD superfamily hydrolase (TIGR01509 family)